jgi:hypothetical protein
MECKFISETEQDPTTIKRRKTNPPDSIDVYYFDLEPTRRPSKTKTKFDIEFELDVFRTN